MTVFMEDDLQYMVCNYSCIDIIFFLNKGTRIWVVQCGKINSWWIIQCSVAYSEDGFLSKDVIHPVATLSRSAQRGSNLKQWVYWKHAPQLLMWKQTAVYSWRHMRCGDWTHSAGFFFFFFFFQKFTTSSLKMYCTASLGLHSQLLYNSDFPHRRVRQIWNPESSALSKDIQISYFIMCSDIINHLIITLCKLNPCKNVFNAGKAHTTFTWHKKSITVQQNTCDRFFVLHE